MHNSLRLLIGLSKWILVCCVSENRCPVRWLVGRHMPSTVCLYHVWHFTYLICNSFHKWLLSEMIWFVLCTRRSLRHHGNFTFWVYNSQFWFIGQKQTSYSTEKHCGDTEYCGIFVWHSKLYVGACAHTTAVNQVRLPVSEHVFAEVPSATITCLHWWKENLLDFYRKQACVLKVNERFVVDRVFLFFSGQIIKSRKEKSV